MNNKERIRIKIAFLFFASAFLVIAIKALKVQIVDSDSLVARSKGQFFRESKVFPQRGMIYDRGGHPLALNIQTYSIFTIPRNLANPKDSIKKLSQVVPEIDYESTYRRVVERDRFTWIGRKVSLNQEQVAEIESMDGIHIEAVPKRLYPNNDLLAQVIGFVGVDNVGLSGIEHRFNDKLKGSPKILRYVIDNRGRPIKFETPVVEGRAKDLHLSIDKDLQFIAQRYLKEKVRKFEANMGGIGVMNARTGEILAVANYPSFDPNVPHMNPGAIHRLPFVTDPFEPGSTFKTFTIASALENGIARPDTNYYCERGQLQIGNHIIREAESNRSYEWLSVNEILRYSSNIGTTKIAFDLTYPKLEKTILDFGFSQRTGIEVPGESRGIFQKSKNVSPLRLSNISFGQGLATTGIQMLAAYAAIANGGYYVTPTIFKVENDKEVNKRRIISRETAEILNEMLIDAVERGTGSNARVEHFTIAGKTSTAQRASETGGYSGYIPGFIGYPVGLDDTFVIYAYIDNPQGRVYYGNRVAAPLFQRVAKHILYNRQEYRNIGIANAEMRSATRDTVRVRQASSRIMGKGLTPNFISLDRRSGQRMIDNLDLQAVHRGFGVVIEQRPLPGEPLPSDGIIRLEYAPPHYE